MRKRSDGRWEERVQVSGKRLSGYGSTPEEAEADLERKLRQLLPLAPSWTFAQYWQTAYLPTISGRTAKYREQAEWAARHLAPIFPVPLEQITRQDLQHVLNIKGRTLSRASVGHIRKFLFSCLQLAEADGLMPTNPAKFVTTSGRKPREIAVLSPSEVLGVLEVLDGTSQGCTAILAAMAGLRLGEAERFKKEHLQGGILAVHGTKTKSANRLLPIGEATAEMILRQPRNAPHRRTLQRYLPGMYWHLLRHSFAAGLADLGCPEDVRAALLGHKRQTITAHYSHLQAHRWLEWMQAWETAVYASGGVSGGVNYSEFSKSS